MVRSSVTVHKAVRASKQAFASSVRHSSLFINLLLISFCMNGIVIRGNKAVRASAALLYHIAWTLATVKIVTCIITNKYLIDLYSGYLIAYILAIILWWTLFWKRVAIHKYVQRLSLKERGLKIGTKLLFIILVIILFPSIFLYVDLTNRVVSDEVLGPRPCRYMANSHEGYIQTLYLVIESTRPYISYSVFFTTFQSFFICGILTWRNLRQITEGLPFQNSALERDRLKYMIAIIKKLEKSMSLPIFLLLSKIAVDIFNGVSALCSGDRAQYAKFVFLLAVPQEVVWFLLVVAVGDSLQGQCLEVIDAVFARQRRWTDAPGDLNYLNYKNLKTAVVLTAGKVFKINRNLLLKALTSTITYAVIISQFKANN